MALTKVTMGLLSGLTAKVLDIMKDHSNINLGEAKAATGTFVDFVGIPEGVKRITVMFDGVSTNGASPVQVQLGVGGVIQSSGYISSASNTSTVISSITGLVVYGTNDTLGRRGTMHLHNCQNWLWVASGNMMINTAANGNFPSAGSVTVGGVIDIIRITTMNGTDLFDAGTINISWEF